jgi:hypothetical protein
VSDSEEPEDGIPAGEVEPNGDEPAPEERRFAVAYYVERRDPGLTRQELVGRGEGGADHAVWVSILGTPGMGPLVCAVMSMDGRTGGPLQNPILWEVWGIMAAQMAQALRGSYQGAVCAEVVKEIRRAKMEANIRERGMIVGPDGRPT